MQAGDAMSIELADTYRQVAEAARVVARSYDPYGYEREYLFHSGWRDVTIALKQQAALAQLPDDVTHYRWAGNLLLGYDVHRSEIVYVAGVEMTTRTKSVSKTRQDRVPLDAYETPLDLCHAICRWLKNKGVEPDRILEPQAAHGNFVMAARYTWPKAYIVANEISPMLVPREKMRGYLLELASLKARNKERKEKGQEELLPPDPPVATLDTKGVLLKAGADVVICSDYLKWTVVNLPTGAGPVVDTGVGMLAGMKLFKLILGNPPYTLGGGAAAHVEKSISLLAPGGVCSQVLKMHFRGTDARIEFWEKHPFAADPPLVPRPDFTGDGRDTVEYTLYSWHRPMEPGKEWRIHCAPAIQWKEP